MRTYSSSGGVKRGLMSVYDHVSDCVLSLEDRLLSLDDDDDDGEDSYMQRQAWIDEPDYSDGRRRSRPLRPRKRNSRYSVHVEYPSQPGHRGLISRTKDGKFVLEDDDEGGFDLNLPPNRFRTRSVAIVAGYSPERLYSNMPPGAFVVESGMYKVGADREWERPEPIYWKQVVFGARGTGSDGSGTLPRHRYQQLQRQHQQQQQQPSSHQVGRLGEEDLRRLRAMDPSTSSLIRTSNLELMRQTTSQPRLRASSPLDQQVPLTDWMSPIHNYSDVSSVTHRERSLPSTLLTNPLSSLSSPFSRSAIDSSQSTRSRLMRSGGGGGTTGLETLHTIDEEAPPAYTPGSTNLSVVQADIHVSSGRGGGGGGRRKADDPDYWTRATYRNADAMFPNYALNYPTPIHGSISPSRQYPDYSQARASFWQSLYVQPQQPAVAASLPFHDYENTRQLQASATAAPQVPARHRTVISPDGTRQQQHPRRQSRGEDQASLVSEVLDAEVTALTNSSSPGSSSSQSGGVTEKVHVPVSALSGKRRRMKSPPSSPLSQAESSSSGIASKNTSQNQTSSSSGQSTGQNPSLSMLSPQVDKMAGLEPILEQHQPFYENWPIKTPAAMAAQYPPPVRPKFFGYQYLSPSSVVDATSVTPHATLALPAKPQATRGVERRVETGVMSPAESLDIGSRPGSAHSAPNPLDVSIDTPYEFDTRTPTDDLLNIQGIKDALPSQWNRPYLGYNPRARDTEMGIAAQLARTERVFSDSEIYSPVFPRGRPEPRVDVTERVQAMKKEFQEYREQQLQQQQQTPTSPSAGSTSSPPPFPPPPPPTTTTTTKSASPETISASAPSGSAAASATPGRSSASSTPTADPKDKKLESLI